MAEHKSNLTTWLLPVVDLMMILIIGLLAVSGYINFRSYTEKQEAAQQQLDSVEAEIEQLREVLDDLEHPRTTANDDREDPPLENPESLSPDKIEASIRRVEAEIARLETELKPLLRRLAELGKKVRELKDEADSYGRRIVDRQEEIETKEIMEEAKRLQGKKTDLERRLASLEAEKARQEELTPSVTLGVSEALSRKVKTEYSVILSKGKIYPATRDFFAAAPMGGVYFVKAKRSGLTVSKALAASSPIMKTVKAQGFRKDGRVTMLVNNDSFAAYRVLRDKLVGLGIDYAWEPDAHGTEFYVNANGSGDSRTIRSQGWGAP